MINPVLNWCRLAWRLVLYSTLLIAILFLTAAMPLIAQGVETNSRQVQKLPANESWLGDFDEMATRRQIRVLVVYSKTFYFLDRGRQRGISYNMLEEFET